MGGAQRGCAGVERVGEEGREGVVPGWSDRAGRVRPALPQHHSTHSHSHRGKDRWVTHPHPHNSVQFTTAVENDQTLQIDRTEMETRAKPRPLHIAITSAASPLAYHLIHQ